MIVAYCHSDREAVFASTRNLLVIPTEKFFTSTKNFFVNPTEKLFLLRRGISLSFRQRKDSSVAKKLLQNDSGLLSFRQRSYFCFDEESPCYSDREKILQSLKSSFRMTVAYCHSDAKKNFFATVYNAKSFKV
jgi:hypothetical protein